MVEWESRGVRFRIDGGQEEEKARRVWDPRKHPRYPRGHRWGGRFIETGDSVTVGGRSGRVTGTTRRGKVQVRRNDGTTVTVSPRSLGSGGSGGSGGSASSSAPRSSGSSSARRDSAPSGRSSSGGGRSGSRGRAASSRPDGNGPQSGGQESGGPGRRARVAARPAGSSARGQAGSDPLPPLIQTSPTTVKPAMADSQRKAVGELNIDDPGSGFSDDARAGAAALRAKQPLTAEQSEAVAAAIRELAKNPSLPKTRQKSLNMAAVRLDSVSAHLKGISSKNKPASGKAMKVAPEKTKEGDLIAFPGPGGTAEVRRVTGVQEWYGEYKFTLEDANGVKEDRFVSPETSLYRFDSGESFSDALKAFDGDKGGDEEASSLYDADDDDADDAGAGTGTSAGTGTGAGKSSGPGGLDPSKPWYDALASHGDDSEPIPVSGLTVNNYKVGNGIAWRRNGRSYLVELKPGESVADAKARGEKSAALLESVLSQVPADKAALQRGLALFEGNNPADSFWAQEYNIPNFHSAATGGFGTTNIWGGDEPKPTTLAHEFGHNVDSQVFGTNQWLSQSPLPVLPDQFLSWGDAIDVDTEASSFYANGRFKETRLHPFVKPITLGEKGVTGYGQVDIREDFAEAVRLWMKDRREGKVGYDPTTGDNLRFSDLFPERARILDAAFGTTTDFNTPVRKARVKEAEDRWFEHLQKQDEDPDAEPPWTDQNAWAKTGLPLGHVKVSEVEAKKRFAKFKKEQAEKEAAEKAAAEAKAAAEKAAAEAKAAEEKAKAEVASIQKALKAGKLKDADAHQFRAKVAAYKEKLREQELSEHEVAQLGAAYEMQLMFKHFGLKTGMVDADYVPGWDDEERLAADAWVKKAGTYIHPKAQKQINTRAQAKANIAAELGDRLNNPDDWEAYRKWSQAERHYAPGPFETYDEDERHAQLADAASARVSQWAGTSGDHDDDAILMQEAVKQEFQTTGPSAPAYSEAQFNTLMEESWESHSPFFRRVSRVMYEHTQEEFTKAGITHVSLFRGMGFDSAKTPDWAATSGSRVTDLQPANSWSSQRSTAMLFTGGQHSIMLHARIPVSLILGSAFTGFGCLEEEEFVVFAAGGDVKVEVLKK